MTQPLGPKKPPNADETWGSMNKALSRQVPHSLLRAKSHILNTRRLRRRG